MEKDILIFNSKCGHVAYCCEGLNVTMILLHEYSLLCQLFVGMKAIYKLELEKIEADEIFYAFNVLVVIFPPRRVI